MISQFSQFSQLLIFMIVVYICVYGVVARICRCVEHCATARSYNKTLEYSKNKEIGNKMEDDGK